METKPEMNNDDVSSVPKGKKNKNQPKTAAEAAAEQRQIQEQQRIQQENVKNAVKKTIEKYYSAQKTTKG